MKEGIDLFNRDFNLFDKEKDFSLRKFLDGFVKDEPKDLDSYVSGGAGDYPKRGLINRELKKYGR